MNIKSGADVAFVTANRKDLNLRLPAILCSHSANFTNIRWIAEQKSKEK